jgi:O-antigen/teichoic acid export membrane protein
VTVKLDELAQSKRDSFIETNVNTWLGLIGSFLITAACNLWIIPQYGIWWATTASVILCTVWSLLRGYYVRRFFNKRHKRKLSRVLQYTHDHNSAT